MVASQESGSSDEQGLCVIDTQRRIVFANPALASLLGVRSTQTLIGCLFDHFTVDGDDGVLRTARARGIPISVAIRSRDDAGGQTLLPIFLRYHVFIGSDGEPGGALLNITRRAFAHNDNDARSARLEMALEAGRLGAWSLDLHNGEGWRTDLHDAIFGYGKSEAPYWSYEVFLEHVIEEDRSAVRRTITTAIESGESWRFQCRILRRDGAVRWISARGGFERDVQGEPQAMFGVTKDITERKAFEERIEFLAYYDPLTQLPNRSLLTDRLGRAARAARRAGQWGVLFFIDLDDFKTLNDTLGHAAGDEMLQEVARRLHACLDTPDTVARFGGDEFVVIMENLGESEAALVDSARQAGNRILHAITRPYEFSVLRHRLTTCSIGAVTFGGEDVSPDLLMRQADLAMYRAKAAGGHAMRFYKPEMQTAIDARVALESEIQRSVENGCFVLYYQAQIDLRQETAKAEALVRWRHPARGLLSPGAFIPAAEKCGLIVPLGRAILDAACRQLRVWTNDPDMGRLTVSVNISARQFHQPNFVDDVEAALKKHGIRGGRLMLELTETILLESIEDAVEKVARLKMHGVELALDDFGTGYSSLYYLKRLPLDQLKIDRRFVCDVLVDGNDFAIVRTIIALAHCMGLEVVAEGVETEAVSDFLLAEECHLQQGFLFSEPLPADAFEAFMRHRHHEVRALRLARAHDATRH